VAGPRVFYKSGRLMPFAQFLVGASVRRVKQSVVSDFGSHNGSISRTELALQPGGGLTVLVTEHVGIRGAVDYRALLEMDEDDTSHEFRVIAGFTLNWGSR
jgi:hypothetical protein